MAQRETMPIITGCWPVGAAVAPFSICVGMTSVAVHDAGAPGIVVNQEQIIWGMCLFSDPLVGVSSGWYICHCVILPQ